VGVAEAVEAFILQESLGQIQDGAFGVGCHWNYFTY